jgi:hypothetical protein
MVGMSTKDPYTRPRDATKPGAVLVGEFYGTRVADKQLNHASGGRNVSSAARYQGTAYVVPAHDASLNRDAPIPLGPSGCKGKNGTCKGRLVKDGEWCMAHDPESLAKRKAATQPVSSESPWP